VGFDTVAGTDIQYGLISFDADGNERPEPTGLMTDALINKATAEAITNVFFFCHGWMGDIPSACGQYERWLTAFMGSSQDRQAASSTFANFRPLLIGLHWPSLPFGDEELRSGGFGAQDGPPPPDVVLQAYLQRLGDRPEIRGPLTTIIEEARHNAAPDELPPHVRQAYLDLNDALGLKSEGVGASPDADRDEFDPQVAFDAANDQSASFAGFNIGGLLGPLRQLSYWTMKKRARTVGEGGMHTFLKRLQSATAATDTRPQTRVHLMGHSFGTIVVSSMIGGPGAQGVLPRPVDSVVLVQGAVSLWSYAPDIPFHQAGPGYFARLVADKKIRGPLVTTRSKYDDAVGVFYPLASRFGGSATFGGFPEFGGMGTYGIQGADDISRDTGMLAADAAYAFEPARIYNLDGSQYICHKVGPSGAHSDISGGEVAHAIWAAALASAH